ncbi:MAG: hypothetical protein UFA98_01035 [Ruminococcus sp.]|nr:hypothetical protein [Ruminococcus sp.]
MNIKEGLAIICREVDKRTGEISTYLCKKNVTDEDLFICKIRSTFNPELQYFVVFNSTTENWNTLEDVLSYLRHKNISEQPEDICEGVVRL